MGLFLPSLFYRTKIRYNGKAQMISLHVGA